MSSKQHLLHQQTKLDITHTHSSIISGGYLLPIKGCQVLLVLNASLPIATDMREMGWAGRVTDNSCRFSTRLNCKCINPLHLKTTVTNMPLHN